MDQLIKTRPDIRDLGALFSWRWNQSSNRPLLRPPFHSLTRLEPDLFSSKYTGCPKQGRKGGRFVWTFAQKGPMAAPRAKGGPLTPRGFGPPKTESWSTGRSGRGYGGQLARPKGNLGQLAEPGLIEARPSLLGAIPSTPGWSAGPWVCELVNRRWSTGSSTIPWSTGPGH
jgi:hypothetical protein